MRTNFKYFLEGKRNIYQAANGEFYVYMMHSDYDTPKVRRNNSILRKNKNKRKL